VFKKPVEPKYALILWNGVIKHEASKLLKMHEFELEWRGIRGQIDEYDDELGYIIEKKTTKDIPKTPYEHHVKQVLYYMVLLRENGYKVNKAEILYIARDGVESFDIDLTPYFADTKGGLSEYDKLRLEMLDKADKLRKFIKDKVLPPREIGWVCDYCDYRNYCFLYGDYIEEVKKNVK
jgi:CRISPR/Cas system-associated exonuclease Cas4 (RecB family)